MIYLDTSVALVQLLAEDRVPPARQLTQRLAFVEMAPAVLARALEPFPLPVRTLDALHIASIEFLRAQGQSVDLASYDARMVASARRLGIPIFAL